MLLRGLILLLLGASASFCSEHGHSPTCSQVLESVVSISENLGQLEFAPEDLTRSMPCSNTITQMNFAFFSRQHTGTTWMSSILQSHPRLIVGHELHLRKHLLFPDPFYTWRNYYSQWCRNYRFYFHKISPSPCFQEGSELEGSVVGQGFFIQSNQGWGSYGRLEWIPMLKRLNVKVIFHDRLNFLEMMLARGGLKEMEEQEQGNKEYIPLIELKKELERQKRERMFSTFPMYKEVITALRQADIPVMYTYYEDLMRHPVHTMSQILEFIGQPPLDEYGVDARTGWQFHYSANGKHSQGTLRERLSPNNLLQVSEMLALYNMSGYMCMLDQSCSWPHVYPELEYLV